VKPETEFRRNLSQEDEVDVYCKKCASELAKAHYVPFTTKEFYERGSQGVLCPLWTKECGVCTDWQDCWRIADISSQSSEYPIPKLSVRKKVRKKELRKGSIDISDYEGFLGR
jgi:hypothetical protein